MNQKDVVLFQNLGYVCLPFLAEDLEPLDEPEHWH